MSHVTPEQAGVTIREGVREGHRIGDEPRDPFGSEQSHRGRTLRSGDAPVTIPVDPYVQQVMNQVIEKHHDEMAEALRPYGLHPYDIAKVEYRMHLYVTDITSPEG